MLHSIETFKIGMFVIPRPCPAAAPLVATAALQLRADSACQKMLFPLLLYAHLQLLNLRFL